MNWRYRHTVLTLCTLAFFATMAARLAISPVVPVIVEEFEVSNAVVGMALTGLWMAYFLSQFPSGIAGDRFGERRIILVAVGGTAVASLLIAVAPAFPVFVLATVTLGFVAGLHYTVATTLLSRTYDDIGTAIGVHNGGAPLAGLLAPVLAAWIGTTYGWRPAVAIGTLFAVPIFVVFARRIRPTEPRRPDEPMADRLEVGPLAELLTRRKIAFTVVLSVLFAFAWQAVASFLPTFLVEHRGYSATLAGVIFSAYFVVQGVAQIGVGAASDRYGRQRSSAGCAGVGAVGFALLVVGDGAPSVVAAVVLVGIAMSWGAALLPRVIDLLSEAERGAGFGLVRTVYGVVGALGSVGTGLVADLFGWAAAFLTLAGLLAVVFLALVANRLFALGY